MIAKSCFLIWLKLSFVGFLIGFACQKNVAYRHTDGREDHVDQSENKENDKSVSCRCVMLANEEEHNGDVGKKAEKM